MLPQPTTPPPTDPAESDYRALLDDLMADAKAVSRLAAIRATQEAETPPPETREDAAISARIVLDLANAQDRAARSIRRNILLVLRLEDPAAQTAKNRTAARKRVIRGVEDAIQRRARDPIEAACLQAELLERLESPEFDHDIDTLPPDEMVENVSRDFNVAELRPGGRNWKRRTPEDIRRLHARAARSPEPPQAAPAPSPDLIDPDFEPEDEPERTFHLLATPNPG